MPPPAPLTDYYALLGVHPTAGDEELRVAWRQLAARWHPDRAGVGATAIFQQLSAAYTVLSDPIARAAYDRRRRRASAPTPAPPATPSKAARRTAPAVMLSRLCKHLSTLTRFGAARIEDDDFITLVLRADEAAQGGMISIPMNVDLWCPDCSPHGRPSAAHAATGCRRCGGSRTVPELYSAWLAVPPGATGGEVLTPSAELPGMVQPPRFRVRLAMSKV
jgi:DnaJ-class molecular chaperone